MRRLKYVGTRNPLKVSMPGLSKDYIFDIEEDVEERDFAVIMTAAGTSFVEVESPENKVERSESKVGISEPIPDIKVGAPKYDVDKLMSMRKVDLIAFAEEQELIVDDELTKREIIGALNANV